MLGILQLELRSTPLVTDFRLVSVGVWFEAGSEAFLIDDYSPSASKPFGLFLGQKDGRWGQEICNFDEFLLLGNHSE